MSKIIHNKRPNRPQRTNEWCQETKQHITGISLSDIETEYAIISDNIIKLPVIQQRITHLENEIQQYEELLAKHKNTPFNPKCNACQQQTWKLLIDDITNNKLPESIRLLESENNQLQNIAIGEPESFEELHKLLLDKQQELFNYIETIKEYKKEEKMHHDWNVWEKEYLENKYKLETLKQEEQRCQGRSVFIQGEIEKNKCVLKCLDKDIIDLEKYINEKNTFEPRAKLADDILNREWKYLMAKAWIYGKRYILSVTNEKGRIIKEINTIDSQIEQQKIHTSLVIKNQHYTTLLEAFPFWKQYKEIRTKEDLLNKKYSELEVSYVKYSIDFQNTIEEIRNRHRYIIVLGDAFDGFREWLYKEKLSKMIQQNCNAVLKLICGNELILEAEWLKTIDTLSWFMRNGDKRCILEKASGFQRFILGIAMRVAISRIGVCKTIFTQMFIDEGFTACDSDNIEKIGGFLRGIMPSGGMYLTTHLEVIKGCADFTVGITANNGIAMLQFGERSVCKIENKKKGRPKKVIVGS